MATRPGVRGCTGSLARVRVLVTSSTASRICPHPGHDRIFYVSDEDEGVVVKHTHLVVSAEG
jgi:hypothetical protein